MKKMKTTDLRNSLELFEIKPEVFVTVTQLQGWLPDIESALWFAKLYELDYYSLSRMLGRLFPSDLMSELLSGDHSTELQDYIVDVVPSYVVTEANPQFVPTPVPGEVLPELWKMSEIEVAKYIQEVAEKLVHTFSMLPSKHGEMTFASLAKMNARRPTIGQFQAVIQHKPVPDVLVILDVSGSMTEQTIRTIIDDVVALSWEANAHFAIVSNDTFYWEPGSYSTQDVLNKAQYGGTYYETLAPLLDRDWGVIITIADYDSSRSALTALGKCKGRVSKVLDISLVHQPTYLSECVGQLADEVTPLLVSTGVIDCGW